MTEAVPMHERSVEERLEAAETRLAAEFIADRGLARWQWCGGRSGLQFEPGYFALADGQEPQWVRGEP